MARCCGYTKPVAARTFAGMEAGFPGTWSSVSIMKSLRNVTDNGRCIRLPGGLSSKKVYNLWPDRA